MALATEQTIQLDSHQFIDLVNLHYHREIAERLRDAPDETLGIARNNLRRWLKVHAGTGTANALVDWQTIIETRTVQELISIITEDSDEGQRLRQSTPFVGVLTKQERQDLFARCEKEIST
jgi:hypothetical protein